MSMLICCWMLWLPSNGLEAPHTYAIVRISESLQRPVADLLADSPTFRRLWAAVIGRRALHLTMDYNTLPMRCRARTRFRRYAAGVVYVTVQIGDRDRARELIAHELEHVREYLEGVGWPQRAAHRTDTWMDAAGRFETARAVRVEHLVTRELRAARR